MTRTHPHWRTVTSSIVGWEGKRIIFSLPNYLAVFLSLGVAWAMLNGTMDTIRDQGLLVEANPFLLPFLATLLPYAVFLALAVAVSLAREMEGRTMEVLFYTPVEFSSFVMGRFLGQMTYYFVALPLIVLFFFGHAFSVNLRITPGFFGAVVLSPFMVACVVGFGILIASLLRRARLTVVVLLVVISLLLVIQLGHEVLPALQTEDISTSMVVLSDVVDVAYRLIEWVSPFVFLDKGVEAAQIGESYRYGTVLLSSFVYTCIALILSILILRRRGFDK